MAGEQLMLVDGQPQTIVVDQQQIAYQQTSPQQQFIVQEANAEQQQHQNSQVYFMQDSMQENSNHSETACDPPIVLNHHMQRGQVIGQKIAAQHLVQQQQQQQPRPSPGIAQVRQQLQVRMSKFSCGSVLMRILVWGCLFFIFIMTCLHVTMTTVLPTEKFKVTVSVAIV